MPLSDDTPISAKPRVLNIEATELQHASLTAKESTVEDIPTSQPITPSFSGNGRRSHLHLNIPQIGLNGSNGIPKPPTPALTASPKESKRSIQHDQASQPLMTCSSNASLRPQSPFQNTEAEVKPDLNVHAASFIPAAIARSLSENLQREVEILQTSLTGPHAPYSVAVSDSHHLNPDRPLHIRRSSWIVRQEERWKNNKRIECEAEVQKLQMEVEGLESDPQYEQLGARMEIIRHTLAEFDLPPELPAYVWDEKHLAEGEIFWERSVIPKARNEMPAYRPIHRSMADLWEPEVPLGMTGWETRRDTELFIGFPFTKNLKKTEDDDNQSIISQPLDRGHIERWAELGGAAFPRPIDSLFENQLYNNLNVEAWRRAMTNRRSPRVCFPADTAPLYHDYNRPRALSPKPSKYFKEAKNLGAVVDGDTELVNGEFSSIAEQSHARAYEQHQKRRAFVHHVAGRHGGPPNPSQQQSIRTAANHQIARTRTSQPVPRLNHGMNVNQQRDRIMENSRFRGSSFVKNAPASRAPMQHSQGFSQRPSPPTGPSTRSPPTGLKADRILNRHWR